MLHNRLALASGLSLIGTCWVIGVTGVASQASHVMATRADRSGAIHRGRVWTPVEVGSRNIKAGPPARFAFAAGETVSCTFLPKPRGTGSTPKFHCALPSGHEIKVRYGRQNGEVYAQVASTRLLWALGFAANRMYPVKVVCRGCAQDPFNEPAPSAATPVVFDPATIDESADGTTMETKPEEGWSWKELDLIDESAGGASVRERDALKLLAVLIQHSSNKSINQRIVCTDGIACTAPMMMIADLGKTFGRANAFNKDATASVNFAEWSKTPIWNDSATECIGNLHWSWSGSFHDPRIAESGRALLAELLNQLTDTQIRDLFTIARVTERDPNATVADWVTAFTRKRTEIAGRHCPS